MLSETGLGALSNWHMVTGPLATLDAVWKAYGVSISVDKKTGLEAHNDVMDFHRRPGRSALPGDAVRRREHDRDLQPSPGDHRPMGPGDRDLRRAADQPVTDPTPPIPRGTALAAPPRAAHRAHGLRRARSSPC